MLLFHPVSRLMPPLLNSDPHAEPAARCQQASAADDDISASVSLCHQVAGRFTLYSATADNAVRLQSRTAVLLSCRVSRLMAAGGRLALLMVIAILNLLPASRIPPATLLKTPQWHQYAVVLPGRLPPATGQIMQRIFRF